MGTWNYRAVRSSEGIGVFGVYYDDHGRLTSIDKEPYRAIDSTREELLQTLKLILSEVECNAVLTIPQDEQVSSE